jgi:serine/threonine protein kinase
LGVLIYEMITGYTPFYTEGMDQISLFRYIVKGAFQFPSSGIMSEEAEDLVQGLITPESNKRLGSLAGGIDDVYAHEWFSEYGFAKLRRKEYRAPWVPDIKDPLDKSNFEDWGHLQDKTLSKEPVLSAKSQALFDNF